MAKDAEPDLARRSLLKGSAVAGIAALTPAASATADTTPSPAAPPRPNAFPNRVAETAVPAPLEVLTEGRSGSDFMVDCIKSLGFDYIAATPGSSFRGLHESLINYGENKSPEFVTCTHEEVSAAMAHGYAKAAGKPLAIITHGTVGLQHASMALYNAWCDRAPIYVIVGNIADAEMRRPGIEWNHSAQDEASIVRDFVKWDDAPASLQHFADSAIRAYQIAITPPTLPVLVVADGPLQEDPIPPDQTLHIPKLGRLAPPQGEIAAVEETARLLVTAENPVLLPDRLARTQAAVDNLIVLAELLQCAVVDVGGRMNFPTRHRLNQSGRGRSVIGQADVILALEVNDLFGTLNSYRDQVHRTSRPRIASGATIISLTAQDLYIKSNYQDFQHFQPVNLAIAADAEATLPSLIEAVRKLLSTSETDKFKARGDKLAAAQAAALAQARSDAVYGWDATPISTARLCAELWQQIGSEDFALVSPTSQVSYWPKHLWNFEKAYQFLGDGGGMGIGYCAPASVGAALANKSLGRLSVALQPDGDLIMTIGALWTAAHHKIPLLTVVHNNRAFHQELMHVQRLANRHMRGIDRCHIGTTLREPFIDFAKVAQGMGVHAEGPITEPGELGAALARAIKVVKAGEPALVDVVTQGR
jgi:acetolactate synthase I/II/III large subunit